MAQAERTKTYTPQQLGRWGLMKRVRREEIIDELLALTKEPEDSRIEELRTEQVQQMRLKGEEELKAWLKLEGLSEEEWLLSLKRQARWLEWCERFRPPLGTTERMDAALADYLAWGCYCEEFNIAEGRAALWGASCIFVELINATPLAQRALKAWDRLAVTGEGGPIPWAGVMVIWFL